LICGTILLNTGQVGSLFAGHCVTVAAVEAH
jgi:hypothetical protein